MEKPENTKQSREAATEKINRSLKKNEQLINHT